MADLVWDRELGWIDMGERPAATDHALFAHATGLYIRGDYAAAEETFLMVEKRFPESPFAPRAMFQRARCATQRGRHVHAVRICDRLLASRPEEINREEVVAFQIEVLAAMAEASPRRAANHLNVAAAEASTPQLQYTALMAEGDAWSRMGNYDFAAAAYAAAMGAAPDANAADEARFRSALSDLDECREHVHHEQRARRAFEGFRACRKGELEGARAVRSAAYAKAIERVLQESDPAHREVFYAVTYVPEKRYSKAYPVFKRAAKRFRDTAAGETGHFYKAECLYERGKYWKAFRVYESFLRVYPGTIRTRQVVNRQFAVGEEMMSRRKRAHAIAAFEAVAANGPNSPLADDAEMYIGRCHMEKHRYQQAKGAFQSVVELYPGSEWANAALFQGGVADLKTSKYSNDREVLLSNARRAFELYLEVAKDGPFAARADELLQECHERQARDLLDIARFYERRGEPKAAACYHGDIVGRHPESSAAKASRETLERFRQQGIRLPSEPRKQ